MIYCADIIVTMKLFGSLIKFYYLLLCIIDFSGCISLLYNQLSQFLIYFYVNWFQISIFSFTMSIILPFIEVFLGSCAFVLRYIHFPNFLILVHFSHCDFLRATAFCCWVSSLIYWFVYPTLLIIIWFVKRLASLLLHLDSFHW
jgi:hypothetical protein